MAAVSSQVHQVSNKSRYKLPNTENNRKALFPEETYSGLLLKVSCRSCSSRSLCSQSSITKNSDLLLSRASRVTLPSYPSLLWLASEPRRSYKNRLLQLVFKLCKLLPARAVAFQTPWSLCQGAQENSPSFPSRSRGSQTSSTVLFEATCAQGLQPPRTRLKGTLHPVHAHTQPWKALSSFPWSNSSPFCAV